MVHGILIWATYICQSLAWIGHQLSKLSDTPVQERLSRLKCLFQYIPPTPALSSSRNPAKIQMRDKQLVASRPYRSRSSRYFKLLHMV